jgi:hypothetical protein
MTELPVRVAWRPRAWSRATASHPEMARDGSHAWLTDAVARHAGRTVLHRQVLAAALRADGLFDGDEESTVTVYDLPAGVLAGVDAALVDDARVAARHESRSTFVQHAALVAVENEGLRP